jgi:hypothetical protein
VAIGAGSSSRRCSWSKGRRLRGPSDTLSTSAWTTTRADREPQRLYGIHESLFGRTARDRWIEVTTRWSGSWPSGSPTGYDRRCLRARVG